MNWSIQLEPNTVTAELVEAHCSENIWEFQALDSKL